MRKLLGLTLVAFLNFLPQACAQELKTGVGNQPEKAHDTTKGSRVSEEKSNKEILSPLLEEKDEVVTLNGCMPGMSAEIIQAQFGPEVKIGNLDFCHREKKEDLDKYEGQLYVFEYGRKKGETGDCMLGYSEEECKNLSPGIHHVLVRSRGRRGPYRFRSSNFDYYYNLKFLDYNLKSIVFSVNTRNAPHIGGYYLKNTVNEIEKVVCIVWFGHTIQEKSRLLGECYQRWLERKSPKGWINYKGVFSKFDLKKY